MKHVTFSSFVTERSENDSVISVVQSAPHNILDMQPEALPVARVSGRLIAQLKLRIRELARRAARAPDSKYYGINQKRRSLVSAAADELLSRLDSLEAALVVSSAMVANKSAESLVAGESARTLSEHFHGLHMQELSSGRRWFTVATSSLLFAVAMGLAGVVRQYQIGSPQGATITERDLYLSLHLVVMSLPIYGLAAYAANESSRHRTVSRWALVVCAQLESIELSSQILETPERQRLWRRFGESVFVVQRASPTGEKLRVLPPYLVKSFDALLRAASRMRH